MRRLIGFLFVMAVAALTLPFTAEAQPVGTITGSVELVGSPTWEGGAQYHVVTSTEHRKGIDYDRDILYVATACSQNGVSVLYEIESVTGPDQVVSTDDLISPSHPADVTQPGTCAAQLIHMNRQGNNHVYEFLGDQVVFSIAAIS